RRDSNRKSPVEPVLQVAGRHADRQLRPDLHFARLTGPFIEALDRAAQAAEAGAARPDDVVVDRIGDGKAALAAGHRVPVTARNWTRYFLVGLLGYPAVARATRGRPVLPVAVDVIRNLVVGENVIHLRDR